MKFLDFDRDAIKRDSVFDGSHYVYTVGAPIEVTAIRKLHQNELLAKKLSTQVKDDSFMTRYCPTNKIYFTHGVVDSIPGNDFVSCYVDDKNCCLYIGSVEEYGSASGVLTFSGYPSLNRLVEENKTILCTSKMRATIMSHVRVLSLGLAGDNIFGLLYIPGVKGIKVAERGTTNAGVSPITYKVGPCKGYQGFTVEDWFSDLTKIQEI